MRRTGTARLAAVVAASALVLAACGGDDGDGEDSAAPAAPEDGEEQVDEPEDMDPVELTLAFWGDFGFGTVADAYKEVAPHVTLVLNEGEYNDQHQDLQTKIVAGTDVPDVAAIDEGFIIQFRSQADNFANLLDFGAGQYESNYIEWKWNNSIGPDGQQIGLGTDVGGLAMCYRRDLFEAAGMPTDRDEVSALWPTWDDFVSVGEDYVAAADGRFVDNATQVFNPVLGQQEVGFYTPDEELVMDGGPRVAFDISTTIIDADLSANLPPFTPEWNAGFTNGDFAVLACPAWMQGYIEGQAPDLAGEWDIADIPGGGGNWGGSWLTVPAAGDNVEEAYKFVEWFTQPEQQLLIFTDGPGNLPSQPGMYSEPSLLESTNEFFNDAPVGEIFTQAAAGLVPQYLGRLNGPTRQGVEDAINAYQDGEVGSIADAWDLAVANAERVVEEDQ